MTSVPTTMASPGRPTNEVMVRHAALAADIREAITRADLFSVRKWSRQLAALEQPAGSGPYEIRLRKMQVSRATATPMRRQACSHIVARHPYMKTFTHILVPTDFSPGSAHALGVALALAEAVAARVTVFHVMEMPASYMLSSAEGLAWPVDELDSAAKRELDHLIAGVKLRFPAVESFVTGGDARDVIPKTADEVGADLIVMGTHGRRGVLRVLIGSVAERVVRTANVPVLTVGPEHAK